jgi:hypothetical protein
MMSPEEALALEWQAAKEAAENAIQGAHDTAMRAVADAMEVYADVMSDTTMAGMIQAAGYQFNHDAFADKEITAPAIVSAGVLAALASSSIALAGRGAKKTLGALGSRRKSQIAELSQLKQGATPEAIGERLSFIGRNLRDLGLKRLGVDKRNLQGARKLGIIEEVAEAVCYEIKHYLPKGKSLANASNQELFEAAGGMRARWGDAIGALIKEVDDAVVAGTHEVAPAYKMVRTLEAKAAEIEKTPGGQPAANRIREIAGEWMRVQEIAIRDVDGNVIGVDVNKPMNMRMAKDFSIWSRQQAYRGNIDPDLKPHRQFLGDLHTTVEHAIMEEMDSAAGAALKGDAARKYMMAKKRWQAAKFLAESVEQHLVDHLLVQSGETQNLAAKLLGRAGYGMMVGGTPFSALGAAAASLLPAWWSASGRSYAYQVLEKISGGIAIKAERKALMDALARGVDDFLDADVGAGTKTKPVSRLTPQQSTQAIQAIRGMKNNPVSAAGAAAEAAAPIAALSPLQGFGAQQSIQRAIGFLASRLPVAIWDADGGAAGKARYNPWEIHVWNETLEAVIDPESVVRSAVSGYVSPRQMEALRATNPEFAERIAMEFITKIGERGVNGLTMGPAKQAVLSTLLGRPVARAVTPKAIKTNQAAYMQTGGQQAPPGGGAGPMGGGQGAPAAGPGIAANVAPYFETDVQRTVAQ